MAIKIEKKIVGYAEEKKVTLCLEMLNSRVATNMKGHPDYFCDDMERSDDNIRDDLSFQRLNAVAGCLKRRIIRSHELQSFGQFSPGLGKRTFQLPAQDNCSLHSAGAIKLPLLLTKAHQCRTAFLNTLFSNLNLPLRHS